MTRIHNVNVYKSVISAIQIKKNILKMNINFLNFPHELEGTASSSEVTSDLENILQPRLEESERGPHIKCRLMLMAGKPKEGTPDQ